MNIIVKKYNPDEILPQKTSTMKRIFTLLAGMVLLFMVSCQNQNTETNGDEEFNEAADSKVISPEEIESLLRDFPQASEIPYYIERSGTQFDESLMNDLSLYEDYLTVQSKTALNIGVFGADVAYLCSYQKPQEAVDYMEISKEMAEYINVTNAFDMALMERFNANLEAKDELAKIIDDAIGKTSTALRSQDRINASVYIITGGYVEGMYLASGIIAKYMNSEEIPDEVNASLIEMIKLVASQEDNVKTITDLLSRIDTDESANLKADFELIQAAMMQFVSGGELNDEDARGLMTNESFINVVELIINIRNQIVSAAV